MDDASSSSIEWPIRRVLRLIQKWLKAGVSEEGQWSETKVGTPQGAVISPLLANVYLHYVFDLWVEAWRKKVARGDVIVVRYADDARGGFPAAGGSRAVPAANLRERLAKFGLELHPEKTRLIEFGRFAESNRKRRGEGKPETFDFLGFTHMCGKTRKSGAFVVRRKTVAKRMRAKLQAIKAAASAADARTAEGHGQVARDGRARLLSIPCGAGQHTPPWAYSGNG